MQMMAALEHLKLHAYRYGADPARLVIAGESAGAQLASQAGALITNPEYAYQCGITSPIPPSWLRGLVLNCGVYDVDTFVRCGFPATKMFMRSYFGRRNYLGHPRIREMSTVRHALSNFPPTYIVCGDDDLLESESLKFDSVLRSKGVPVLSRFFTGSGLKLGHGFMYELNLEPASLVFRETVDFIRQHTRDEAS